MKTGTIKHGSAQAKVSYSQMVAPHLRGKLREISSLIVDQSERGHGSATELMHILTTQADESGLTLLVVVEPFDDEPIDGDRLRNWYERLGFIEIQHLPCVMARPPRH